MAGSVVFTGEIPFIVGQVTGSNRDWAGTCGTILLFRNIVRIFPGIIAPMASPHRYHR